MKLLLDQNLSRRRTATSAAVPPCSVRSPSIWLALGNCSTSEIERRLRRHRQDIKTFVTEPDTTLLVIEPGQGTGAT